MQETRVQSLHWEDPLEKGMAIHSSILAWRIPWTEEPGGLQSMGSQRVGHSWATDTYKYLPLKLALYYTVFREPNRGMKDRDTAMMDTNGRTTSQPLWGKLMLWIFHNQYGWLTQLNHYGGNLCYEYFTTNMGDLLRAGSLSFLPTNLCSQPATMNQCCSLFGAN